MVATEVKTLANETGKATLDIRERIEELRHRMTTIVSSMKNSAKAVDDGREVVTRMGQELRQIAAGVDTVSRGMTEVSSILTEQSAASNEVSQSVEVIAASSEKNDHEITTVLNHMDEICGALSERISGFASIGLPEAIIEITKNDHALFKKSVFDVLARRSNKKASELSNHESCRLGKWYYAVTDPVIRDSREFQDLEADHIAVHQLGKDALMEFEKGNEEKALDIADKLNEKSHSVIERLEKLRVIVSGGKNIPETQKRAA